MRSRSIVVPLASLVAVVVVIFTIESHAAAASGPYIVTWDDDDTVLASSSEEKTVITQRPSILGRKRCTYGPSYWCHNITQASECHAVKHCIKKVWETHTAPLPKDDDNVCKICKDMVQQARDQLISNETQEEIREVFEGSCALIPIKLVANECKELADKFIPDLVDALASRMDPQMVCAISGLCNSVRIDEMLGEMKTINNQNTKLGSKSKINLGTDSCPKCNHYVGKALSYLQQEDKHALLMKLLDLCGDLGSYSDSCRRAVTEEFDGLYGQLHSDRANSYQMCGLVGLCQVETLHKVGLSSQDSAVRKWTPPKDDDLPCDFCKDLVSHVQTWMVANTTKEEFEDVLRGICKQSGKWKSECLHLTDEYADKIYRLLVDELDAGALCQRIGVCPNGKKSGNGPLLTILPALKPDSSENELPMLSLTAGEQLTGDDEVYTAATLQNGEQLAGDDEIYPIGTLQNGERIAGDDETYYMGTLHPGSRFTGDDEVIPPKSTPMCQFCEFALHTLQTYIDDPTNEAKVKEAVDNLCNKHLPAEMASQCNEFIRDYGDSIIALIAQQVDPSTICPEIHLCLNTRQKPSEQQIAQPNKLKDIPTCPLCQFTIGKLIEMIGKNHTKEAIDHAMENVCYILPRSILNDCLSFMKNYGDRVAEMILIEGTTREICFALHLCILGTSQTPTIAVPQKKIVVEQLPFERYIPQPLVDIDSVKVRDEYIKNVTAKENAHESSSVSAIKGDSPTCVICEFVLTQLDNALEDNSTETEIKEKVERICTFMPKTVKKQCTQFIDMYGDMIIAYLVQNLDPAEVCIRMGMCKGNATLKLSKCQLCVLIAESLASMMEDPTVEINLDKVIERICPVMPHGYQDQCRELIEDYGPYIMSLLGQETDKGQVCPVLDLCPAPA